MTRNVFWHQEEGKACRGIPSSDEKPLCIHKGTTKCQTLTAEEAIDFGYELIQMGLEAKEI